MKLIKYDETTAIQGIDGYFSGTVMIDSPFASEIQTAFSGAMVNFSAGARTVWHCHPRGQTLIIIA